jgi:NAD(P)H-hydrate repair Nnr-like enzyme with NAD(P)H-hydrate epimerase domain
MERASKAFVGWFINHFPDKKQTISVYCGTGNNGGDGLAIARLLNAIMGTAILISRSPGLAIRPAMILMRI